MSIELTDSLKNLLKETVLQLKGAARRRFMAQTVLELGYGGNLLLHRNWGGIEQLFVKELKN